MVGTRSAPLWELDSRISNSSRLKEHSGTPTFLDADNCVAKPDLSVAVRDLPQIRDDP